MSRGPLAVGAQVRLVGHTGIFPPSTFPWKEVADKQRINVLQDKTSPMYYSFDPVEENAWWAKRMKTWPLEIAATLEAGLVTHAQEGRKELRYMVMPRQGGFKRWIVSIPDQAQHISKALTERFPDLGVTVGVVGKADFKIITIKMNVPEAKKQGA